MIKIDSVDYFQVTAVLKSLPSNTRFDFEYLLPWDYLHKLGWSNDNWLSNNITTFVLLKPNTNVVAFNNKIQDIARRYSGNQDIWTHFLFPLEQWHLYAIFKNGKPAGGRIEIVRLFTIVAILILLIACINFINLSTAKSEKRAKEVGVRKVAGAGKGMLVAQFMTEALLMSSIAGIIGFSRSIADNLKRTENIFKRHNPNYPFNYQFTDQEYARMFDAEQRIQTLAGLSALLAIFITCLGLFGLSAYIAERRVKEIGVRKALGASVFNITQLLTLDFMKLVVVAVIAAIPIASWSMNLWPEHFDYKITISWVVFVFAGSLAIGITLLTVSFEVIRAAMVDPVKSLRRE